MRILRRDVYIQVMHHDAKILDMVDHASIRSREQECAVGAVCGEVRIEAWSCASHDKASCPTLNLVPGYVMLCCVVVGAIRLLRVQHE